MSDLSLIDSIIRFKQPIFLFGLFVRSEACGARLPRHTVDSRYKLTHSQREEMSLWRTPSGASCGEPCMLLLLVLFTQTYRSHFSARTQHWPKGCLLIWHGENMGLKVNEGSDTATPQGGQNSSTSQTKCLHRNTETTNKRNNQQTTQCVLHPGPWEMKKNLKTVAILLLWNFEQ